MTPHVPDGLLAKYRLLLIRKPLPENKTNKSSNTVNSMCPGNQLANPYAEKQENSSSMTHYIRGFYMGRERTETRNIVPRQKNKKEHHPQDTEKNKLGDVTQCKDVRGAPLTLRNHQELDEIQYIEYQQEQHQRSQYVRDGCMHKTCAAHLGEPNATKALRNTSILKPQAKYAHVAKPPCRPPSKNIICPCGQNLA